MAKNESKLEDQFQQVEQALTKTEQFIEDNHNVIVKVVVTIIVLIGLVLGYDNFYIKPLEKEAQTEMYIAENYFQKDSFNLALNGDGQYYGFLDYFFSIISYLTILSIFPSLITSRLTKLFKD